MDTSVDEVRPLRLQNAVRRLRRERAWTIDELARRAGVSRLTVIALERGTHEPRSAVMLRICEAFGLPLGAIFWSDDGRAA